MSNGSHPSQGRLGWLLAALLFGVIAGGGIAWILINRRGESSPVVIYQQMPAGVSPAATPPPDPSTPSPRRRHRVVHAANELPGVLENAPGVSPPVAPSPELAAGIDGGTADNADPSRQTVLVDGVAITKPAASPGTTPGPTAGRVMYETGSAPVEDSLTLAADGIDKYVKKGYSLREDAWGGELLVGKSRAISHQLFKGNDYWFGMGCAVVGAIVRVRLYDTDGKVADLDYWQHEASDGSYAAAEIQCQRTGTYFIVVSLEKAPEERVPWGMVYAYR